MDAQRPDAQRARSAESAVGAGPGCHDQAAVRAPGRRSDRLQPAQAGPAQPRAAHLLGGQPAAGARCGAQPGQAAHLGARQGGAGAAARRARRAGPGAGARRLWLRQRRHHRRVRAAQLALPAAPAQDGPCEAADRAAVRAPGLDGRHRGQRRLAGDRGRIAPERLQPRPGAWWCCAGACGTTWR